MKELIEEGIVELTAEQREAVGHLFTEVQGASGQPEPPKPTRKPRKDKGIPKGPKAFPDFDGLVTLKVTVEQARAMAAYLPDAHRDLTACIHDQVITQLQKRIDALSRVK